MTVGASAKLSEVVIDFGSSGTPKLSDYVRGGTYVPNVSAYNTVSTTSTSLQLSQFASLTGPIRVSPTWGSNTGAAPRLSATGTLFTPGSGSGTLKINITSTSGSPTINYSKNGAAFAAVTNGMTVAVANNDTIRFRVTGVGSPAAVLTILDNANSAQVGLWECNV